ncbi:thioredoxin family protein [Chromobacterium sp. IIBBL 290-4]|uniref:thioredoxin family protein n=1 Tax=Chromobacterium sp. IIBBL 290-4 TaxID=2953890 RepID=UPI0020B6807A|nr:thioredoxin family protein [Chromobacterium sp. IIBBL 290-4]UTH74190.1 thioredoxin family protein [Chromobacterium sp. IIBBL 290-4]
MNHYRSDHPGADEVAALPGLTLLEFGIDSCPHCQRSRPLLDAFLATHLEVRHLALEDGRGRRLGRQFGVKLWPTFILLREGKEAGRAVRPADAQALNLLDG